MVPSSATSTDAVNACWLPTGMFSGVSFTLTGPTMRPPLSDCEKAIESYWKSPKRASCHTAYSLPLRVGSTATSGMMSPVLTSSPVSGSVMAIVCSLSTRIGADHVSPSSFERSTLTVQARSLFLLSPLNSANRLTSVPSGRTTIWLAIVWSFWPGS